eukprot:CAMPEP_0170885982 /NCGR_PEP_ID=MMETSP0734-20130129/36335_1 /TAXON_ID=186038 /ORGANISM="Fragilariopsis kerguelensis, Strain L26-C5" /LENGTH=285 /DNA_ID=CAMNT_0011271761 /DNA_START=116 /DNA_END=974 /DNA_ORIENTATION=+
MIHAFFVVACFCLLDVLNLRKVHSFSAIAPIHEDRITPFHSPEDVVRKQLDAFQRSDIKAAFACGSTEHQDVCGPTSNEFKELLLSEPAFSTLIGHTKSTVLMTTDCADGEGKCCYVRIIPSKWKAISSSSNTHHHHQLHKRSCLEYWFELSKTPPPTTQTTTQSQQNNEEEEDSTWTHIAANLLTEEEGHETEEGCWMIDSILPDFEDLSLVSFEADDHDDDTVEDGIYYVNNNANYKDIDTDADADNDDEISQIIIKNMIQQTVVDSNDTDDDDEDDGVTEYE